MNVGLYLGLSSPWLRKGERGSPPHARWSLRSGIHPKIHGVEWLWAVTYSQQYWTSAAIVYHLPRYWFFHCSIVLSTASSPTMLPILTSLLRRFLPLAPPVEKAPPLGSNALSWEGFSLWLHFIVLVTSFLRRLPLVAPVEKATSLGSNASCDYPSPMPSSGKSREQSEAEAGS